MHLDFGPDLPPPWRRVETGGGRVETGEGRLRLINVATTASVYTNAQIDDYHRLPRWRFPWRPPLTLTVQARFSTPDPPGTAGFGFWNEPLTRHWDRLPALPQALWFLYTSPPSHIPLAVGVPGCGWKAAVLDARRPTALALAPTGPVALLLLNLPGFYRRLWPLYQRALGVAETVLTLDKTTWHTYQIVWGRRRACFRVDHEDVLTAPAPPGPLGLVVWLDNQYLIATPWGRLQSGLLAAADERYLEIARIEIMPSLPARDEGTL